MAHAGGLPTTPPQGASEPRTPNPREKQQVDELRLARVPNPNPNPERRWKSLGRSPAPFAPHDDTRHMMAGSLGAAVPAPHAHPRALQRREGVRMRARGMTRRESWPSWALSAAFGAGLATGPAERLSRPLRPSAGSLRPSAGNLLVGLIAVTV